MHVLRASAKLFACRNVHAGLKKVNRRTDYLLDQVIIHMLIVIYACT